MFTRTLLSVPARWVALAGTALGALGCTALIDGSTGSGQGNPAQQPPSVVGSSGGSPAIPVVAPNAVPAIGPAAGRRLTKQEYLSTLTDLLGVDLSVRDQAGQLPDDQPPSGASFRNDVSGLLPTAVRTDAYEALATLASAQVSSTFLASVAPCADASTTCRASVLRGLGRLLYRRPLTDADVQLLQPLFDQAAPAGGFEAGVRLVLRAMLQSPHFLYRLERLDHLDSSGKPAPSAYELATRLAYFVWQSAPSASLLDAAERGDLDTTSYATALSSLLQDTRAKRGFQGYATDWLQLYRLDLRTPNAEQGVSVDLLTEMREELMRFVTRVAFVDAQPLSDLLTDKHTELGPGLAAVYGVTPPAQGFATYDLTNDPHRVGLLTEPGFLILRAAPERATIVHRGLMVQRTLLCQEVPAPPANAATQSQSIPQNLTDRDRFAQHAKDPTCHACHATFDPLGQPFEPFDLAGRFRSIDQFGNPLRSDGELTLDGKTTTFADTAEFATALAKSPTVERCFVQKSLQYALGRALVAQDTAALDQLSDSFEQGGRNYAAAVTAVAQSPAFRALAPAD